MASPEEVSTLVDSEVKADVEDICEVHLLVIPPLL